MLANIAQSATAHIVALYRGGCGQDHIVLSVHRICIARRVLQDMCNAKQLGRSDDRLPGSSDISLLSPELQQQWDVESNLHLGATKITPQRGAKAVWTCNKCPDGQPHIWTANVYNRTRGSQCPYCSNRHVCLHNSLAALAPDAAQYWNHSKNEKAPDQVLAGSNYRAEWKCPTCKWEWQAPLIRCTRKMSGCPKCSQKRKSYKSQPTFAEAQPACFAEWDYELNDDLRIYPDRIALGSGKLVHWICSCCPRGQPHRWTASPNSRIGASSGCAVCAGKQACVCNSLAALFPDAAAEFDEGKNGFAPSEVPAGSGKKV